MTDPFADLLPPADFSNVVGGGPSARRFERSDPFADLMPSTPRAAAPLMQGLDDEPQAMPERTGMEAVSDAATRIRQGLNSVVGGAVAAPVNIANMMMNPPHQRALNKAMGIPTEDIAQPDFVRGIQESLSVGNELEGQGLSDKAKMQAEQFQNTDGFVDATKYLIDNPSYALTEGAAQIPQFLQLVPGSVVGTVGAQAAGAASQSVQQIEEELRKRGVPESEIKDRAADAFAQSMVINSALPMIPGGTSFDRLLAGKAEQVAGAGATRFLKPLIGETVTEGAQESTDQVIQNYAQDDPLGQGVGQAAALGTLMGTTTGGIAGGVALARGDANAGMRQASNLTSQLERDANRIRTPESDAVDAGREAARAIFAEADADVKPDPRAFVPEPLLYPGLTSWQRAQKARVDQAFAETERVIRGGNAQSEESFAENLASSPSNANQERIAELEAKPEPTLFEREELALLKQGSQPLDRAALLTDLENEPPPVQVGEPELIRNGTRVFYPGDTAAMRAKLKEAGLSEGMRKTNENGSDAGLYFPAKMQAEVDAVLRPSQPSAAIVDQTSTEVKPVAATPKSQVRKPFYEMTAAEIAEQADRAVTAGRDIENRILGDRADEYRKAVKQANSSDPVRADAGAEKQTAIEQSLTEEEYNQIAGIGEDADAFDEVSDYRDALEDSKVFDEQDAAERLGFYLSQLGRTNGQDPSGWNRKEQVAYSAMRNIRDKIEESGWDSANIQRKAIQRAASRFSDPNDAEFMLERFLRPATPKQKAIAQETKPAAPYQGPSIPPPKKQRNQVRSLADFDPNYHDVRDFIALNGGLDAKAFKSEFNSEIPSDNMRFFGKPLFRQKGGMKPDQLRERLQEAGFLNQDSMDSEARYTPQDAYDLVDRALDGQSVYHPAGVDVQNAIKADEDYYAEQSKRQEYIDEHGVTPELDEEFARRADAMDRGDLEPVFSKRAKDRTATPDMFGATQRAQTTPTPRPASGDLFGAPTSRERLDAAQRDSDARLTGPAVGMRQGDGELFAGTRPEQKVLRSQRPDTQGIEVDEAADLTPEELAAFNRQVDTGRGQRETPFNEGQRLPADTRQLRRPADAAATPERVGMVSARGDSNRQAPARQVSPAADAQPDLTGQPPKFGQWFRASKMKDEAAKPMEFHHATDADFEAFDPSRRGSATGFAPTGLGNWFSRDAGAIKGYGSKTLSGHLRLENPKVMDSHELPDLDTKADYEALAKKYKAEGHDGLYFPDSKQAVAFDSVQFKEKGNSGEYSESPNIFKSQRKIDPQTETPAFKKWFKSSKVVDESGKPLRVYHGTPVRGITTFDPSRAGSRTDFGNVGVGIYTTPQSWVAKAYAKDPDSRTASDDLEGEVLPLYLAIENPLRVIYDENYKSRIVQAARSIGVTADPDWRGPSPGNRKFSEQFTAKAQEAGYDGVFTTDVDGGIVEAVAFRPEQIKSAIGNNGQFDPANPSILKSESAPKPKTARLTDDQVKSAKADAESRVASHWGRSAVNKLKTRGRVEFITKQEVVDRGLQTMAELDGVDGFFDPESGKAYVIVDSGAQSADLPGVLSHEVFHANAEQFLGTDGFKRLKEAFRKLKSRDKDIAAAYKRVPSDTSAAHVDEEGLAYLAQEAPKHRLSERLTDEAKLFLNRLGIPLDWLNAHAAAVRKIAALNLKDAANRGGVVSFNKDGVKYQKVFHGTPHRGIEKTGFSLQKIGTGEGAQAYGYGMYFAGNKDIAEHYRKTLSAQNDQKSNYRGLPTAYRVDGKDIARGNPDYAAADIVHIMQNYGPVEAGWLTREIGARGLDLADTRKRVKRLSSKTIGTVSGGQLYHAEIPEDSDLLDWDKPLSEQPEKVRVALERAGIVNFAENIGPSPTGEIRNLGWAKNVESLRGEEIYRRLIEREFTVDKPATTEARKGSERAASEALMAAGIPGLRYLDGSSRNKGEGSANYVIWDENLLTPEKAQITPYYSKRDKPKPKVTGARPEELIEVRKQISSFRTLIKCLGG